MMKVTIKRAWVRALRSGEFPQGKGLLAKPLTDGSEQFCCLGVLCELARAKGIVDRRLIDGRYAYFPPGSENGHGEDDSEGPVARWEYHLPDAVCKWAGLMSPGKTPQTNPAFGKDGEYLNSAGKSLTAMNDGGGYNFDDIAAVIDEHF
jgi:hypothetical protein